MMNYRSYAMDTHFMCDNQGPSIEEQLRLVKEAGYDDSYVTGAVDDPEKLLNTLETADRVGLGFNAAFQCFDISQPPTEELLERTEAVVSKLPPGARFEIALTCGGFDQNLGNVDCDGKALDWLRPLIPILERYNIEASLYPHFGFYLETLSDALRLAGKTDHPLIKVIFCGYHWYRVGKEPSLGELIDRAAGRLNAANLCGSRHLDDPAKVINGLNPSIEPLDTGHLDNSAILHELKRIGYNGPIGIQGYGVNCPANEALTRSFKALQQLA